jgi:hypothetical protein
MAVEKVSGGRSTRSASHHLAPNQLYPINNSYGGNENTHHILEIPLAKLPFLV